MKFNFTESDLLAGSGFRRWCTNKWYEHKDEVEAFTGKPVAYTAEFYFDQYKYWLKREYKHNRG